MFTSDECLFMLVYFCKCKFFGLRVLLQRIFLQQQQIPLVNSCWLFPITVFSLRCPDAGSRTSPSLILPRTDGQTTGMLAFACFWRQLWHFTFSSCWGSLWYLQPWKADGNWLKKDISYLPQHPGVQQDRSQDVCGCSVLQHDPWLDH